MALSFFDDKSKQPRAAELAEALGRTSRRWDELKSILAAEYDPLVEEWKFSGKAYGWSLRLGHKKRPVVYLTPCKRHFLIGRVLGEKAFKAACKSKLPTTVLEIVRSAPKYPEGRGVRLEVRNKQDLAAVVKLAGIKMAP